MAARDPRAEAQAALEVGLLARVLEPSPPAVTDPAWFADDPVQGRPAGRAGRRAGPAGGGEDLGRVARRAP